MLIYNRLKEILNKMKKGFTLVEMLGVIVIVGLIVIVVIPFVANVINNSRQKLYDQQLKNIELAAMSWGSENMEFLPKSSGDSVTIFLYNLKFDGFITKDIINPITGEPIPDDLAIEITKTGKTYKYEVLPNTGGQVTAYDSSRFRIILNGALNQHVELSSLFAGVTPEDILALRPDNEIINSSNVSISITESNLPATEVLSTTPKIYYIEYKINYDGIKQSVFRTITVSDTLPPTITFAQPTYLLLSDCPTFNVGDDVTITDNSGSWTLDVTGTLTCEIGTYTLIYKATDMYGNVNEKERTINVVDQLTGGEEPGGLPNTEEIAYINNPTEPGYNGTPCLINELEFTHIEDKRELDPLDHKTYAVTKIGTQCWFAENLAYTGNGCLSQVWNDDGNPNACRANGGTGWDQNEILYQWRAAMNWDGNNPSTQAELEGTQGLCPVGWHVPTYGELLTLRDYLLSNSQHWCGGVSDNIAKSLASTTNWATNTNACTVGNDQSTNNSTGYAGQPAGYRSTTNSLYFVGSYGFGWTSTPSVSNAVRRALNSGLATFGLGDGNQAVGVSVQCILN